MHFDNDNDNDVLKFRQASPVKGMLTGIGWTRFDKIGSGDDRNMM